LQRRLAGHRALAKLQMKSRDYPTGAARVPDEGYVSERSPALHPWALV